MKRFLTFFALLAGCGADEVASSTAALLRSEEVCPVVSGAFHVDVPRVRLSGDFRINGAAPLPFDNQTGVVELRSKRLGVAELGSVHAGSYSRWVIPGVYDLVYRHAYGDVVPANVDKVLMKDVSIVGGTLDIDIESVLVMGAITLNGGAAPASVYEQGVVRLRDRQTGGTFDIGRSLDGEYFAMVIPGEYDVVWSRTLGGSLVPANGAAVVLEEIVVDGLTELDIDIPAVLRTGDFRINGAPAPASVYENGTVSLRDVRTGDVVSLGQTRLGTYSKKIVPGTYDILYSHVLGGTIVPKNPLAVIATGVEIAGAGAMTIDIPAVTLGGTFALDGAAFPASAYNRAKLWLQGAEAADVVSLGTTSSATYAARVVPGTYDVVYQKLISTGLVPENGWTTVVTDRQVSGPLKSGLTLDIDVSSAVLEAEVTLWGDEPPASVYENGTLRATAAGDTVPVGETRDAGGSVRLLAGTYELRYGHLIGGIVPANGDARVGTAAAGETATIDLRPGSLHGDLTQGGVAFPAGQPATVALRDVVTGDLVELGTPSDGEYDLQLLGGTYEIVYSHESGAGIPANRNARLGCVRFTPPAPLQVGGLQVGN